MFGVSFDMWADETSEYLQHVYDTYTAIVDEVKARTGLSDPIKISIIAGILLTDDLEKERLRQDGSGSDCNTEDITHSAERMIALLDRALDEVK